MKLTARIGTSVAATLALTGAAFGFVPSAFASTPVGRPHAVFVETDNPAGNQVVAYSRAATGQLELSAIYQTGGVGGVLDGSVVDHQASQGALAYDSADQLLIATNAGSNTVSVFAVSGSYLHLTQIVSSKGSFPVSVSVHGSTAYVLNARDGGSVTGYQIHAGRLTPIAGSTRALGLDLSATPEFVNTPGQVAFSPDGHLLLVTTKANGNDIDVFHVSASGNLSLHPVINPEPGAVPFALVFTTAQRLEVVEAGPSAVATFSLSTWGDLRPIDTVATNQAASCWIARDGRYSYVSNAGSATETGLMSDGTGHLSVLGNTATDPGTVDAVVSPAGKYLYVRAGLNGNLDEFAVNSDGSLTSLGSLLVPDAAGGEGIAVS